MKIGIDIRALDWSPHGGIAEYIKSLLPVLFKLGSKHTFHLFVNSYKSKTKVDYLELFNASNVEIHQFNYPNKLFTPATRFLKLPNLDKMVGGVDVFFNPHILPVPVSSLCKKVTTFHDLSFERFSEFFNYKMRLWHGYISPKIQAETSDKIIAVSFSTKKDLMDIYGISFEKIFVIHSGISNIILQENNLRWNAIKRKYALPENYILSFSKIEPRKNILALIYAYAVLRDGGKFNNLKLVIAGDWGWSYKKIVKEAKNSKYVQDIIFTGEVSEEEKSQIYKNSKVFVYPSLYEGFGFPPLEAMHFGIPTIVSMSTSLPEITEGAAILIDPTRPREIANAITEILTDERLYSYFSNKAYEQSKKFRWEKTAVETLKVLENV